MIYLLAGYGLLLFFAGVGVFLAYRRGLQDGLAVREGKEIAPLPTPAEVIEQIPSPGEIIEHRREKREAKQQEDRISQGLANILAYDGRPQKTDEA